MQYVVSYLNAEEQQHDLTIIDQQPWLTDLKRRVQHYGYRYDYTRKTVDTSLYLGPLPDWAAQLAERLHHAGYAPSLPDQLIVNEYVPGQGIASHVDCVLCFGDTILALSLGSTCLMQFTHLASGRQEAMLLEPGSLLVLQGEARYGWKHGIPARKSDTYQGEVLVRQRRVSLTLRTVMV